MTKKEEAKKIVNQLEDRKSESTIVILTAQVKKSVEGMDKTDTIERPVGHGEITQEDKEEAMEKILDDIQMYNQIAEEQGHTGIYKIMEVYTDRVKHEEGVQNPDHRMEAL